MLIDIYGYRYERINRYAYRYKCLSLCVDRYVPIDCTNYYRYIYQIYYIIQILTTPTLFISRISREWRQKIETWLQSNENDERQNEEYKRKRRLVNANRRSLENETGESLENTPLYCLLSHPLYIHPYSPFRKRTKTGSIARGEDHDDINNNNTGDSDNVANDKH